VLDLKGYSKARRALEMIQRTQCPKLNGMLKELYNDESISCFPFNVHWYFITGCFSSCAYYYTSMFTNFLVTYLASDYTMFRSRRQLLNASQPATILLNSILISTTSPKSGSHRTLATKTVKCFC
jgi:hypothetical protein